jgi:transposase-like protein
MVWLHLSQAIEEEKRYEKCRECAAWFELSRGKAHKDRQYCSEMCKVNAYRKRKTEALRYHLDGKKPGEIARIVGSDIETVKGWIATIKKEE